MMTSVVLELDADAKNEMWSHLLSDPMAEQAAFAYVEGHLEDDRHRFSLTEWTPVSSDGFTARSGFYIELTDETRAAAIKRAHDLGTSLVELHSHLGRWPAAFSASDWSGFQEFVPHVWWRLKGRPYLAIVVTHTGFDGLAWITGPSEPQRLDALLVGPDTLRPTGLSAVRPNTYDE
jgi:hypothetical protein